MTDQYDPINELLGSIKGGTKSGGTYQCEPAVEQELDAFVDWLKVCGKADGTGMTSNTASSYRSYCAKAIALKQSWDDMTSDQHSAVRKLKEFREQA